MQPPATITLKARILSLKWSALDPTFALEIVVSSWKIRGDDAQSTHSILSDQAGIISGTFTTSMTPSARRTGHPSTILLWWHLVFQGLVPLPSCATRGLLRTFILERYSGWLSCCVNGSGHFSARCACNWLDNSASLGKLNNSCKLIGARYGTLVRRSARGWGCSIITS